MTRIVFGLFLLLSLVTTISNVATAQRGPLVPYDDGVMTLLESLQIGEGSALSPHGDWPLHEQDLSVWLEARLDGATEWERKTMERIRERLFPMDGRSNELESGGIRLRGGMAGRSQERDELMRRQADAEWTALPLLTAQGFVSDGSWTAALGLRFDRDYEVDLDGLDAAHRWLSRGEHSYLARDGERFGFFMGRVARQLGGLNRPGLMFGTNARPMDQLALRFSTSRVTLRSVLAELDSMTGDGRFTGIAGDDSVATGSERRYLALHRLSFDVGSSWSVALSHGTLYSGPQAGWSMRFMNPFHVAFWTVDERPKNEENNGIIGAWAERRADRSRLSMHVALDDFDVLNGEEPASVAVDLAFDRKAIQPGWDVSLSATLVSARTYNADQPEGRYTYLQRGIATQFSDYIQVGAALHRLRFPGWRISPGIAFRKQGEMDIRAPFPKNDEVGFILDGTVETTIRPHVRIAGLSSAGVDLFLDAGWSFVTNENHVDGQSGSYLTASASILYRLNWYAKR